MNNSSDWFNAVYCVLMTHCDAPIGLLQNFVAMHTTDIPCDEYRFQGRLGFGGKYRRKTNRVDCYPEDATPERLALITETNQHLAYLEGEYSVKKATIDNP